MYKLLFFLLHSSLDNGAWMTPKCRSVFSLIFIVNCISNFNLIKKFFGVKKCSNQFDSNLPLSCLYHTQFEITGDPCNLIGSQQCNLFLNCTFFFLL